MTAVKITNKMKMKKRVFSTIISMLFILTGFSQNIVIYLHGKIVENQGPDAVDTINGYGAYKYFDIIEALKKRNLVVISAIREPNTNVTAYAQLVANQIDSLLKENIKPQNITVIGASKGSIIAMYVSSYVKNKDVNYVFMGACDDEIYSKCSDIRYYGNILSIYEKSDSINGGSCKKFKERSKTISRYREIELNTGLKHGFMYRPIQEWLDPAAKWANNNYDFKQITDQKLVITHLTGGYYVFTTYKTFKNEPMSANGLFLVTDMGVVMIDTPWDTTQFQPLLDSIEINHKKKVVICIATHSHEDRTGGLEYFKQKGIKTYTTKQTDSICEKRGEKRAEFVIMRDTTFKVGQYSFQTFYAGEGHTKDNIVVWFDKDKILYGGCLLKSTEARDLGYVKEANLKAWPLTLNRVKQKFKAPKYIITGHQDWSDNNSIQHTLMLLQQHGR